MYYLGRHLLLTYNARWISSYPPLWFRTLHWWFDLILVLNFGQKRLKVCVILNTTRVKETTVQYKNIWGLLWLLPSKNLSWSFNYLSRVLRARQKNNKLHVLISTKNGIWAKRKEKTRLGGTNSFSHELGFSKIWRLKVHSVQKKKICKRVSF